MRSDDWCASSIVQQGRSETYRERRAQQTLAKSETSWPRRFDSRDVTGANHASARLRAGVCVAPNLLKVNKNKPTKDCGDWTIKEIDCFCNHDCCAL